MKTYSIEEITKKIILAEEKYQLFNIKYKKKYPIWPFYRMYFYFDFLKKINTIGERGVSAKKVNYQSFKKLLRLLFNSRLNRAFKSQHKKYIIISSSRYNKGEEIYTRDLKKVLNKNYLEFSLSNRFNFQKGSIYLDFFKILFKLISLTAYKFTLSSFSIKNFVTEVGASLKSIDDFRRYKIEYVLWYWLFRKIFKIQKPYKIFFVSGVYYTPMIAAAQSLNILVYEIQHGIINNFHLAYQFPNISRDGFFSDGLLLLSDYWKTKAEFPIGTKLITIGNDFYAQKRSIEKIPKMVLVISAGILAKEIIFFVKKNIDFLISNGYQINYKLHPDEIDSWEERYEDLKVMRNRKVLKVVTNTPPLPEILSKSEIVFGVSSTVLYESLDKDCNVFILDLLSSEYFNDLIENGSVKKINSNKILTREDLQFTPNKCEKFFAPTDFNAIKRIIK